MPSAVIMPQMGESIFEGTITKWLKQPGEPVQRDEPLFEISTDKVDAEIPAPSSGILREIKAPAGSTVQVNTVVALIDEAGSVAPPSAAAAVESQAEPRQQEAAAKQDETVIEFPKEGAEPEERLRSSPLVRRLARENQVDLHQVPGTGLGGRITRDDILRFIEQHPGGAPAVPAAPAAAAQAAVPASLPPNPAAASPAPATPAPAYQTGSAAPAMPVPQTQAASAVTPQPPAAASSPEIVPMSAMRKKIAERMVESKRVSAHVHSVFEVDMTRIVRLRERVKADFEKRTGTRLTFMPFFCRAVIQAIGRVPIVNSSVEGDNIHYHPHVNLGIAVALDWGLIVPVIKNAEEKNFLGLQRAITDLAGRARLKKLVPDEVAGGTFTVTNPGNSGQLFATPIILQPQVAILGVGNIRKQPVVVTDESGTDSIAVRSICHLSLGFDHRIVDGAVADQFLAEVVKYLQNWNEDVG